ncbi:hypothetical protein LZ30DRAFT_784101 [Colletotrichum cereale]|nr:hypothetical protein LZ30DRAFT_784101 [Colletotrichum cereale]
MPPKCKAEIDDTFQSRIIKFVVGRDRLEYNVHEAIIVNLSDPLRALVTNGMKESLEGKVVWEDVEMDTFTKLLQFAYEHDYTIIDPDEVRDDLATQSLNGMISMAAAVGNSVPTQLASDFAAECSTSEEDNNPRRNWEKQCARALHHSHEHYISHVRLYILADRYAVLGLMDLSMQKIRNMLANNPLEEDLFTTV